MKGLFCLIVVPFVVSFVEGACKGPWKGFRDSCYLFVDQLEDWKGAVEDCSLRDGWLVDISDEKENDFVHSNLHDYWNWHYIGLNDRENEGIFKWSGRVSMGYENFWEGEPNDFGGDEDCVEMRSYGKWNDIPCSKKQYYICERDSEIDQM